MAATKRSKNQIRRERLKLRKQNDHDETVIDEVVKEPHQILTELAQAKSAGDDHETRVQTKAPGTSTLDAKAPASFDEKENGEEMLEDLDDPLREYFAAVFSRFQGPSSRTKSDEMPDTLVYNNTSGSRSNSSSDVSDEESSEDEEPLSKRQWRLQNKVSLAALKSATKVPSVVEWCDADAPEPFFLVQIKSQPNIVPVPAHWSAKRDYLSSRRGYEKPPFELPKFIRDTGIQEMRSGVDDQTLRQQQRDRVQPKMGRLDIDYQKLHDAFFKHQTPPQLLGFGHVYFEGRELGDVNETLIASVKPGVLSAQLRVALGMPEHDTRIPPPWILVMQQEGKSPGYRNMIIPGVDQEYNNDGYYDKNLNNKNIGNTERWGQLQELDEEDDKDPETEQEEEEGNAITLQEQDENIESAAELITDSAKIPITEFGRSAHISTTPHNPVESDRPLYTVLHEESAGGQEGLMADKITYTIGKGPDSMSDEPTSTPAERRKPLGFKF